MANDLRHIVIISGRSNKVKIIKALQKLGIGFFSIIYGKSSVRDGAFLEALGMTVEQNKVVITSIMRKELADATIELLINKFSFQKSNTGFAFSVPIECVSL